MCTAILNNVTVQVGANRVIHTVPYLVNNSSGQIRAYSTATFSYIVLRSFSIESVDRRHDGAPHCKGREEGVEIRRQGIPRRATPHCLRRTLATLPVPAWEENLKFLKEFTVSNFTNFTELNSSQKALKNDNWAIFTKVSSGGMLESALDKKLEQNWRPPGPPPRREPRWLWTKKGLKSYQGITSAKVGHRKGGRNGNFFHMTFGFFFFTLLL